MTTITENNNGYRVPTVEVVDFVVSATLCQTSSWTIETGPEEDWLP